MKDKKTYKMKDSIDEWKMKGIQNERQDCLMKDERHTKWKTVLTNERWKTYKIKDEKFERHYVRQDWWIEDEGQRE